MIVQYQLKPSFFKIEWTLKIAIFLQLTLVFCRVCVKNQAQLLLPDGLNLMLMFTTYYQKNYCLAIVAMFFDFSLIYITTLFFLGLVQAQVPLFIEPFSNFTYMMIFSGSLYLLESFINYYAYREYKAIIYEMTQYELHHQQEIQHQQINELAQVPEQIYESEPSVLHQQQQQQNNPRYQQSFFNQNRNQAQPQGDFYE